MTDASRSTALGVPPGDRAFIVGGCVLLAALLGWFAPVVSGWAAAQPWIPFSGPIGAVGDLTDLWGGWGHWVAVGGLVVLGLIASVVLIGLCTTVVVGDGAIVIRAGDKRTRVARAQVRSVELDGRRLSLRDADDIDLATVSVDVDAAALRAALDRHAWPSP